MKLRERNSDPILAVLRELKAAEQYPARREHLAIKRSILKKLSERIHKAELSQ